MELIYSDASGNELGMLIDYTLDVDIGKENDFELVVPASAPIREGFRIFSYGSECGGVIKRSKVDTASNDITYGGYTWRGMLLKKVIRPLSGQDHRTVSGNVATVLNALLAESGLSGLFVCDPGAATISNYQFARYCTLLDGVNAMLRSISKRLDLAYRTDGKVHIRIEDIADHSEELEFSDDCNIQLILTQDKSTANHLICLGKGELKDREVLDLYVDVAGNVSKTQTFFGLDEIVEVYDYSGSEDLEKDGIKKLQEMAREKAEMNVSDVDVALYDIVGARDYRNGSYIKREVTQKIIRVKQGTVTTEYKVGD